MNIKDKMLEMSKEVFSKMCLTEVNREDKAYCQGCMDTLVEVSRLMEGIEGE